MIVKPILVIGINAEGKLEVQGPIKNKVQCYGFLEAAKDVIRDFVEESPIIPPPPGFKIPTNLQG